MQVHALLESFGRLWRGCGEINFLLTVYNVVPTVNTITIPLDPAALQDQPVSVTATFSDPAGIIYDHSCSIDFGDGTGPRIGTVDDTTCHGSYTYLDPGVYTVTVTVNDKDGGSGSRSTTNYIVIYDPTDGFVTGGGWINSPEEAYVPDPTQIPLDWVACLHTPLINSLHLRAGISYNQTIKK